MKLFEILFVVVCLAAVQTAPIIQSDSANDERNAGYKLPFEALTEWIAYYIPKVIEENNNENGPRISPMGLGAWAASQSKNHQRRR